MERSHMYPRAWFVLGALMRAAHAAAQGPAVPQAVSQDSTSSASPAGQTPPPAVITPLPAATPSAPDFPRGKISGYAFGDYYFNAVGDPRHAYSAAGTDSGKANIDATAKPITRDLNGFQTRRLYFQLDNDLSIKYSSRLRLEIDGKSLTSDGKIGVAVRSASIQARHVYPRGDFFFGILT